MNWQYSDDLGEERIRLLSCNRPFHSVAPRIRKTTDPASIQFGIDKGYLEPVRDCLRPIFLIPVNKKLGDLFFNGVRGYRAEYYRSPTAGEKANRIIIDEMITSLVVAGKREHFTFRNDKGEDLVLTEKEIIKSLKAPSAKIWPSERKGHNPEFHDIVNSGHPKLTIDIQAERWVDFAQRGITNAKIGVRAPEIGVLEIKGGFLNHNGEERIPEDKILRSCEIHKVGFT